MTTQERGMAMTAHPTVHLSLPGTVYPFVLDGEPALFLEHEQQIIGLNGSAGALVSRLIEGTTLDELRYFAIGDHYRSSEREDFEQLLLRWSAMGIIQATIDWDSRHVSSGTVRCLNAGRQRFVLHFDDSPFGAALDEPYIHLHGTDRRGHRVAVSPWGNLAVITIEGQPSRIVPREQAGSQLRFAVVQSMLDSAGPVALHAACVVRGGEAILLCGSPGTGKSTLTLALAQRGFDVGGDDITMFDPATGEVCGVPLPLTLKPGSWDQLGSTATGPEIRADGIPVRYAPLPRFAGSEWVRVRAIVALDRSGETEPNISALPALDGVRNVFAEAHTASGRSSFELVRAMIKMVSRSEVLRLSYAEAQAAASQMEFHFGF